VLANDRLAMSSEVHERTLDAPPDWRKAVTELLHARLEMSHGDGQAGGMRTSPTPPEAEAHLRRLLEDNDMPPPDEVEHHPAEMVFLYHEQKLALTFELDERWPPTTLEPWPTPSSKKAPMKRS
jgi:hypothetical protein